MKNNMPDNPPLVAIVGETGTGKSTLSMQIALQFDGEIIEAGSTTVYKGFDIGTAKPSINDRKKVTHHMIDIVTAEQKFTVAQFKKLAEQSIADISNRNKLPILVGGSGLYIDSILFDYEFLKQPDNKLRDELNAKSLEELTLLARQLNLDTSSVDAQNKRRVIRLIESKGQEPVKKELRPNTLVIGVSAASRNELEQQIIKRIDKMFADGLEAEVEKLAERYGWDTEPMKAIGYREFKDYFYGSNSLSQVKQQVVIDSLRLAKKQRTWFRRNKSIHWVSQQAEAVDLVTTFLNK